MNKTRKLLIVGIIVSLLVIVVCSFVVPSISKEDVKDTSSKIQQTQQKDEGKKDEHASSNEESKKDTEKTPEKSETKTDQKQEQANQSSVPNSSSSNMDSEGTKEETKDPTEDVKDPIVETISIQVSIKGVDGAVFVQEAAQVEKGYSAFDALSLTCTKYGMPIQTSGFGKFVYVQAINGLKEKDYGAKSGWKYNINNAYVSSSSGAYILQENDIMEWYYVYD